MRATGSTQFSENPARGVKIEQVPDWIRLEDFEIEGKGQGQFAQPRQGMAFESSKS